MNKPWTSKDLAFLRKHAGLGAAELADRLGRTRRAVEQAAHRHRISLRPRGERRGTLLGQPRGVRLRDLLPADIDRKTATLVLARQEIDAEAELCPSCAQREIAVRTTGLCWPCHKRRLADVHRDLLAEQEAQRELWRTRQQLKRARDKAGAS